MGQVEKTAFISYRRTNAWGALAVFQNLTQHGFDVFFDYNGIAAGDFEQSILENIRARAHFLVLLTPSALDRCGDPSDWLRREIETALATRRNIIPLTFEGFDFSSPAIVSQLTGTLEPLRRYQALRIPVDFFDEAMARLRTRFLNVPLTSISHPASIPAQQTALLQKVAATSAPLVRDEDLTAQQWFERGFAAADPDEQLRCYSEAIRLNANYAHAFINRGTARYARGDLDGAIQDDTEAIRIRPDIGEAYLNRGIARRDKGDLDGALADQSEHIRLKPAYARAFCERGIVRCSQKDLDGALQDQNEAIRLDPTYATAYINRGMARCDNGDFDGALQDQNEAIHLGPDDPVAFANRGIANYMKRDYAAAVQDYTEAIRLKPDYANAFYNRSLARRAHGDNEGALRDRTEATRLGHLPQPR